MLERLRAEGLRIESHLSEGPGHATEIARECALAGRSDFLAVGGDGTAYEVLNGFLPSFLDGFGALDSGRPRPALSVLPLGTGNSLVRDFAFGRADLVLERLVSGERRPFDVLRLHAEEGLRLMLGNLSLGFPAEVGVITERYFKRFGHLGYSLAVLVGLASLRPIELDLVIDGRREPRRGYGFLCLNNIPTFGGTMKFVPEAEVDDGLADLVLVDPIGSWELLRAFPRVFRGTHVSHPALHFRRVREVCFPDFERQMVLLDGELEPLRLERVEVLPRVLDLLM